MKFNKYNKLVETIETNQTHGGQTNDWAERQMGEGGFEIQTIEYEVGSRMYCST